LLRLRFCGRRSGGGTMVTNKRNKSARKSQSFKATLCLWRYALGSHGSGVQESSVRQGLATRDCPPTLGRCLLSTQMKLAASSELPDPE
jgi:hypothetical protein